MKVLALFALITLAAARAAVPDTYVGAQVCKPCHAVEFASQSSSAHAAALSRTSDRPGFPPPGNLTREPHYRYQILRLQDTPHVRIDDGVNLMELPLEWAFGAGRQATTLVTRVNPEFYVEHYATWYPATSSYGPTPGQEPLRPKAMAEAAGVLYKISDPKSGIQGCFECHSTGPVSFDAEGQVKVHELGVHCESCHGPGGAHAPDPRHHPLSNPGKMSPALLNDLCGRCHRPPAGPGVVIDWNYAWNVRHQPVYLAQSRCFLESRKLSCLTCHDPHEPAAKKPAAFFNAKCLQCHAGSAKVHPTACLPRGRTNCIDCHMPLVSPQPQLRFTNHWIGIYRSGDHLKPHVVAHKSLHLY